MLFCVPLHFDSVTLHTAIKLVGSEAWPNLCRIVPGGQVDPGKLESTKQPGVIDCSKSGRLEKVYGLEDQLAPNIMEETKGQLVQEKGSQAAHEENIDDTVIHLTDGIHQEAESIGAVQVEIFYLID